MPDINQVMITSPTPTTERERRFELVFRQHYEAVRRHAVRCGATDPDDVAADTFAAFWRRMDDVQRDLERAWLVAAARRVTANQRRAAGRRVTLAEAIAAQGPTTVEIAEPTDPIVAQVLEALRPLDRQVLLLSTWDELEPAEIAYVLGLSRTATAVRLHRARTRFRDAYLAATHAHATATLIPGGNDA